MHSTAWPRLVSMPLRIEEDDVLALVELRCSGSLVVVFFVDCLVIEEDCFFCNSSVLSSPCLLFVLGSVLLSDFVGGAAEAAAVRRATLIECVLCVFMMNAAEGLIQ